MVGQGFETKDLGPMMKEAGNVDDWEMIGRNPRVHMSGDRSFLKIRYMGIEQTTNKGASEG